jgi:serine protease Do
MNADTSFDLSAFICVHRRPDSSQVFPERHFFGSKGLRVSSMRKLIGIAFVAAAAGLLAPAAFGQAAAPRARSIANMAERPSYLGIGAQDIDNERASALRLKEVRGAEVKSVVPDSPASGAGFKEGDVVLEYNGQPVEGSAQLTRMVRETPVGRQVKITVWRNGSTITLTPTLEASKGMVIDGGGAWVMPEVRMPEINIAPMSPMEFPRMEMSFQNPVLGIYGESLGNQEQLAEFFGVKDGVLVKSVTRNSAGDKAGIKAGDVVVKVDETHVASSRDISSALRAKRGNKTVTVTVIRNKKEVPLTVTIETAMGGPAVRALTIGPVVIEPVVTTGPLVLRLPAVHLPAIRVSKLPAGDRVI